jgi:hypothetical protein
MANDGRTIEMRRPSKFTLDGELNPSYREQIKQYMKEVRSYKTKDLLSCPNGTFHGWSATALRNLAGEVGVWGRGKSVCDINEETGQRTNCKALYTKTKLCDVLQPLARSFTNGEDDALPYEAETIKNKKIKTIYSKINKIPKLKKQDMQLNASQLTKVIKRTPKSDLQARTLLKLNTELPARTKNLVSNMRYSERRTKSALDRKKVRFGRLEENQNVGWERDVEPALIAFKARQAAEAPPRRPVGRPRKEPIRFVPRPIEGVRRNITLDFNA